MSANETSSLRALLRRLGFALAVVVCAALAGLWLGNLSVPKVPPPPAPDNIASATPAPQANEEDPGEEGPAPPAFLWVTPGKENDWTAALGQVRLAAAAGHHQYIIPLRPPWGPARAGNLDPLAHVLEADPKARVVLAVDLNPPRAWRAENPDELMVLDGAVQPWASPSSAPWRADAKAALDTLLGGVRARVGEGVVGGVLLRAMTHGQWYRGAGADTSPATVAGFRAWLRRTYGDETTLQAAWGDEAATFEEAAVPEAVDAGDTATVFFALPAEQRHVDYLRFTSEATADAIADLASHLAEAHGSELDILAPYGFTFELPNNDAGHFALGVLLDSDVDGFVSPVSYADRGLGGVGGVTGPVDSAMLHGKRWYLLDDTRTHVSFDAVAQSPTHIEGIRPEDVYNVQRRNFSTALVHGMGLIWYDPDGTGQYHDARQWREFAACSAIYREVHGGDTPEDPIDFLPEVLLVVDEKSRFYQRCGEPLNRSVLTSARDAALRCGASLQVCLLQDVIDDLAPPSPVLIFTNIFHLGAPDREAIHTRLARDQASAIWLYAPGFIGGGAGAEGVSLLTGMTVKALDAPAKSGSLFTVSGQTFMKEGAAVGKAADFGPLFYVDEPEAFALTKYLDSDQVSAAIHDIEASWTSVFVAEPALTPALLREILEILEAPVVFQATRPNHFDAAPMGKDLLGIHARTGGERIIDLGAFHAVQDLFDSSIGWPQKDRFVLPMDAGETRLFRITPL